MPPEPTKDPASEVAALPARRVVSIDALRGVVMFTMIFVNDLAGVSPSIVPGWMRHFKANGNGMTFVDLVFPAFLFLVGMSVPLALGGRLQRGEPPLKVLVHVALRTLSLLVVGVMMVNEAPDARNLGWSPAVWSCLMYASAMLAFSSLGSEHAAGRGAADATPGGRLDGWRRTGLRAVGFAGLLWLALCFRGPGDRRILSFAPLAVHTSWYGILGLIGWAYFVASAVYLVFRTERTALLGCAALLLCLYPAERTGAFEHFWPGRYVGIGATLGSQASISVAGVLLATVLVAPVRSVARFAGWFVAGCSAAAWLLHGLYGINKNSATPSWCLWACAITGALWFGFHWACDGRPPRRWAGLLSAAGRNVLLAYLLSEMFPSVLEAAHLGGWYDALAGHSLAAAATRSAACAAGTLALAVGLNRWGFRLRL